MHRTISENNTELIAIHPVDRGIRRQKCLNLLGDNPYDLIAKASVIEIIDTLKLIYSQNHYPNGLIRLCTDQPLDFFLKFKLIKKPGQVIY